jgi:hypothetical protein
MATTYEWNVNTMCVAPSADGLTDVVKSVQWKLRANNGTQFIEAFDSIELGPPSSETFIQFNNLTQQEVISWVESKIDVNKIKQDLQERLDMLANPPIIVKQAPWV